MPKPPLTLATPIEYARGVGPARAEFLHTLRIRTCEDLLLHFPRDYLRYEGQKAIKDMTPGDMVTARGAILQTRQVAGRTPRQRRFEALLDDGSARCMLTWFNAFGLADKIAPGQTLLVTGKVTAFNGRAQMVNPRYEIVAEEAPADLANSRIIPVYPASTDLTTQILQRIITANIDALLPQIAEWLPQPHLAERRFLTRREAIDRIHRPNNLQEAQQARRTLAYHEFLLHQSAVAIKRHHVRTSTPAVQLRADDKVDARIRALLDFPLTAAQNRVIDSIRRDIGSTKPMNRLLQGDVGSGKTVVALYAMLCAAATQRDTGAASPDANFLGHQAALMAPTEILAEQHFITLSGYLEGKPVRVGLLVGNQTPAERAETLKALADGSLHLVVGTHALLTESVQFKSLALVVIDEQHKFGVEHRQILRSRHGAPHTLVMTATPIPRTLAMTAFGDLDVSVIDELPPGRVPIQTRATVSANREQVYHFVATRLRAGDQAYIVLPAIDDGSSDPAVLLDESGQPIRMLDSGLVSSVRTVVATQEELQKDWLKDFQVGLLHGRMKRDTRQHIMERFRQGLIHAIVSTTVIEVGVDVPNATVMVVEHADRFGLSQLHQLRGRVGRSAKKSFCILVSDQNTDDGVKRIQAMVKHASGFKLAEEDLRLRGMGQILGTAQSGRTDFHFADLLFDSDLLTLARRDAFALVAADPRLLDPAHLTLRTELLARFADTISLADIG